MTTMLQNKTNILDYVPVTK